MDWLLPVRPAPSGNDVFEVIPHSAMLGTYGSFLMACAVRAATATVDQMALTSLRSDFLSPPGDGPLRFEVERTRSGRSAAIRRVVVHQDDAHAVMVLAFGASRQGADLWQRDAVVADPEEPETLARHVDTASGIALLDVRSVHPSTDGFSRRHPFWARPAQPFGDGIEAAAAAIVMATDHFVTASATPPDEGAPDFAVTMDHSVWVHRDTRADEWLRYDTTLTTTGAGRSVLHGVVNDLDGQRVASFVQQALRRGSFPIRHA